jgi:peptidyl-prolyl cis-trans isomerase-like 4
MITLNNESLEYLNKKHTIFGEVAEGLEILDAINKAYVDKNGRPH